MPIEVTENYIRIRVKDPSEFQDNSFRTIWLDKNKGIKAIIGKLKGQNSMTIQSLLFVKDKWTEKQAKDWVDSHKFSFYEKDLFRAGVYPSPDGDETLKFSEKDLDEIVNDTNRFLELGGEIPVVISHPKSESEKIQNKKGKLLYTWHDGEKIYGLIHLDEEGKELIEQGKVQSVSPGLLYDVVTADGEFKKLFDHIALTSSPHFVNQEGFRKAFEYFYIPRGIRKVRRGSLFYGESFVNFEFKGGEKDMDEKTFFDKIKEWFLNVISFQKVQYVVNLDVNYLKRAAKDNSNRWDWSWTTDADKIIEKGGYKLLDKITLLRVKDANPETKAAYKFPVAKIINGKVTLVWGGVRAAMQRLMQVLSRGLIDKNTAKKAYNKLAQLYKLFDKEPPEFESYKEVEISLEEEKELMREFSFDWEEEEKGKKEDEEMAELERLKEEYEALKEKYEKIEKEKKELEEKIKAFEAEKEKERKEAFERRIEELIEKGELLPKYRSHALLLFEKLKNEKKLEFEIEGKKEEKSVEDFIIETLKTETKTTETKIKKTIEFESLSFDLSTLEGRNEFSDFVDEYARKNKMSYEEARAEILRKAKIKEI